MRHDPTADCLSWELRGIRARDAGNHEDAIACFKQAVGGGRSARAWLGMALSQMDAGRNDDAVASLRHAAMLAPQSKVVAHTLAALTGDNPGRAPDTYVAWLFNGRAARFDDHLSSLGYRGPELLAGLAAGFCRPESRLNILDLGCGTGLSGVPFRPYAQRLEGIDLSAGMIAQARRRGIFDQLHNGEIHAVLRTLPAAGFDLILAADTLIYIGDIDALVEQVAGLLKPGGSFLFTVESGAVGSGFHLAASGRYSHAADYIHAMAAGRLQVASHVDGMIRVEAGRFIEGRAWRLVCPQG